MRQSDFKYIIAFSCITILLYSSYFAFNWGLADVYYRPANNTLERWKRDQQVLTADDWDRLHEKIFQALALDPGNPDIIHAAGTVTEGRYVWVQPGDKSVATYRHAAADYYRKAINLRPDWPYTWADLVMVKYRLDELDDEYYRAMHTAMKHGRWEPGIQRIIAYAGLRTWNTHRRDHRTFIIDVIKDSLASISPGHAGGMLKLVEDFGRLGLFCLIADANEAVREYCRNKN